MNYKTPGVYIEEISLLPPSVAQVETAIPAFIGYTKLVVDSDGKTLLNVPKRIKSFLEFENLYGGAKEQLLEVTLGDTAPFSPTKVDLDGSENLNRLHPAMRMFFANGGGPCYVVSVGDYDVDDGTIPSLDTIDDADEMRKGLDAIRKIDEITLIVFPEADRLGPDAQSALYQDALRQCLELQDRFAIFDVRDEDIDGSIFRNSIGNQNLNYGAAYYPYLKTTIPYPYSPATVKFKHAAADMFGGISMDDLEIMADAMENKNQITIAKATIDKALADAAGKTKTETLNYFNLALNAGNKAKENAKNGFESAEALDDTFVSSDKTDGDGKVDAVKDINGSNTKDQISDGITELADAALDYSNAIDAIIVELNAETGVAPERNDNISTYFTNAFESEVKAILSNFTIDLPPSSTVAGIYAKVDNTRGVWKSPANISINNISGPTLKITNSENDNFNVHTTGKSINVIRSFTGKGTLIWGARTLDGNSNEWRYISVRRFFLMVEESIQEAADRFVFEPNDENTWVKVKAMIENFLILQWRAGALMGAKPNEAFFVKVGLGETMTQDDVFNGRMIVEIGLAAVRPAEFIILRFSHKMLEA